MFLLESVITLRSTVVKQLVGPGNVPQKWFTSVLLSRQKDMFHKSFIYKYPQLFFILLTKKSQAILFMHKILSVVLNYAWAVLFICEVSPAVLFPIK